MKKPWEAEETNKNRKYWLKTQSTGGNSSSGQSGPNRVEGRVLEVGPGISYGEERDEENDQPPSEDRCGSGHINGGEWCMVDPEAGTQVVKPKTSQAKPTVLRNVLDLATDELDLQNTWSPFVGELDLNKA